MTKKARRSKHARRNKKTKRGKYARRNKKTKKRSQFRGGVAKRKLNDVKIYLNGKWTDTSERPYQAVAVNSAIEYFKDQPNEAFHYEEGTGKNAIMFDIIRDFDSSVFIMLKPEKTFAYLQHGSSVGPSVGSSVDGDIGPVKYYLNGKWENAKNYQETAVKLAIEHFKDQPNKAFTFKEGTITFDIIRDFYPGSFIMVRPDKTFDYLQYTTQSVGSSSSNVGSASSGQYVKMQATEKISVSYMGGQVIIPAGAYYWVRINDPSNTPIIGWKGSTDPPRDQDFNDITQQYNAAAAATQAQYMATLYKKPKPSYDY